MDPDLMTLEPLLDPAGLRLGWRASCPVCGWQADQPYDPERPGAWLAARALADDHADEGCSPAAPAGPNPGGLSNAAVLSMTAGPRCEPDPHLGPPRD